MWKFENYWKPSVFRIHGHGARPCAAAFLRSGFCGAAPALGGAAWLGRGEAKGGIPLDAGVPKGAAKDRENWEDDGTFFWIVLREHVWVTFFGWRFDFFPVLSISLGVCLQNQRTRPAHCNFFGGCFWGTFLDYSDSPTTFRVLTVIVKAWCPFKVFSGCSNLFLVSITRTLPFLTEVSHETVARRPLTQPSRHFVRFRSVSLWRGANFEMVRSTLSFSLKPVRSLSLWHGANFEIARATLPAFWACECWDPWRNPLTVARCSFLSSRRCCAEVLRTRSLTEVLPIELVQRASTKISQRDSAKRLLLEILRRDLVSRILIEIL